MTHRPITLGPIDTLRREWATIKLAKVTKKRAILSDDDHLTRVKAQAKLSRLEAKRIAQGMTTGDHATRFIVNIALVLGANWLVQYNSTHVESMTYALSIKP